ncbi:MAG TPA: response regulator [Caulobacteraceae bacterium]|nr:response regulator [Caulobacteraceae bacterium]
MPKRVLVVEDEAMVAMLIEDLLADLGCEVAALACTATEAVDCARGERYDAALLDVNLGQGETSFAAAEVIIGRGLPFAFLTGYGLLGVRPDLRDRPVLSKPVDPRELKGFLGV